ncbi:heat shock protein DnaJ domain-containing protein [Calothrix sp. NIES-4101]|nr:heat shock protein DnaJ domain-containing protein [Calothrix sp. NIES-4101]
MDIYRAYEVLSLMPGASQEEIKQAYRQLMKIWHPDGFTDTVKKQEAEERTKIINAAYKKLKSDAASDVIPPTRNPQPKTQASTPPNSQYSPPIKTKTKVSPKPENTNPANPQQKASSAERFYEYGIENVRLGKYEDAINDFTQAIRINPYYIEAYKYRGLLCSQLGYELRATADLTKAKQLELHFRSQYRQPPAASPTAPPTYSSSPPRSTYQPKSSVHNTPRGTGYRDRICNTFNQVFQNWFRFKRK